jgi:hypothetical protein
VWSARLDQQANRIVTASADYNVYAPPRSSFLPFEQHTVRVRVRLCVRACGSIEANEPHTAVRCGAR